MKFIAYAALVLGASALSLKQMSAEMTSFIPQSMNVQLTTEGPGDDFEKAIKAELEEDGDVDLKELYAIVKKIAKKYEYKLPKGWKKHVKKIFEYVDADHNGKVTGKEIEEAMKKHEEEEDVEEESSDPEEDFEEAIKAELKKDGSVELKELYGIVKKIAKKYEYKLPKGWKKHVKKIFDYVDANHDGHVTGEEIEKAMKEHEEEDVQLKDDPMEDFEAAIKAELEEDGNVDLEELYDILKSLAKKYKYKLPKGWKKHVKKMFDYVDANGDGKVTGKEIEKVMEEHDEEDLELDEPVATTMLQLGLQGPKEDMIAAFKHVYTTGDKAMSFKEFDDIVDHICKKYNHPAPSDADLKKVFDAMDADSDGKVTLKELVAFAKKHAPKK